MPNIQIWFPIQGAKRENIPSEEVRMEIRKIEEKYCGLSATIENLSRLNGELDNFVNKPYGLKIKAEIINNNVKLYGYDDDSKVVLDPNCNIHHISKTRVKRLY
jgi:hypothetical protein